MKKSKARARKQSMAPTATKLPPKKATNRAAKDASSKTKKTPELHTREFITRGTMDLDPHLLQMNSAKAIAKSLKRSADESERLDAAPFHSALSVLSALISHVEMLRARLDSAKKELRTLYNENDEKPAGEHVATPPNEFAKKRSAPKGPTAPSNDNTPSDNRPRSRPNKVV